MEIAEEKVGEGRHTRNELEAYEEAFHPVVLFDGFEIKKR